MNKERDWKYIVYIFYGFISGIILNIILFILYILIGAFNWWIIV
jgi:hypothetical protein